MGRQEGQDGKENEVVYASHEASHCNSKITRKSTVAMTSVEDLGEVLEAEFCPVDSLVREGDGLEDGVAVGEVREVDIPDGVVVGRVGVEVEWGVSRLEGIGMGDVNDGTGEAKEPVMLSMLSEV